MAGPEHAADADRAPDRAEGRGSASPDQQPESAGASMPAPAAAAAPAAAGATNAGSPSPGAAPPASPGSLGATQVRAKSIVAPVDDPAEKHADREADRVMRMAAPQQNRPTAVQPGGSDASSRGPGPATAVPPVAKKPPETEVKRQAKSTGTDPQGGRPVSEATERYLDESQGTGSVLPDEAKRYFETRFSTDLSAVRIHDDEQADRAAKSLGALAFTRGSDIWFRTGEYDPVTDSGRPLLAHELAHIAQQQPGIGRAIVDAGTAPQPTRGHSPRRRRAAGDNPRPRAMVHRATPGNTPPAPGASGTAPTGNIDTARKFLRIDQLPVPGFKASPALSPAPFTWHTGQGRESNQRSIWLSDTDLRARAAAGIRRRAASLKLGQPPYYLKGPPQAGEGTFHYIGSAEDIGASIVIPRWGLAPSNPGHRYDVDHKKELQIGGKNLIDNMWLLDPHINRSSGSFIRASIRRQVNAFLAAQTGLPAGTDIDKIRAEYTTTFGQLVADPTAVAGPTREQYWEPSDIGGAAHVRALERIPDAELRQVRGDVDLLVVYQRRGGGQSRAIPLHNGAGNVSGWRMRGHTLQSVSWTQDGPSPGSGKVGDITARYRGNKMVHEKTLHLDLLGMPGVNYGGYIDPESVAAMGRNFLESPAASPIEIDDLEFDLERGLVGRGVIPTPSNRLLEHVQIAVVLDGADAALEATISGGALQLPGPFKVTGGEIVLTGGTAGLSVTGRIDFEIGTLARGHIGGGVGTGPHDTLELEGAIDFDTAMFTEAHLGLTYRDGQFGVQGHLAVGEGKIAGIRSARVSVDVHDDTVTATGTFNPSVRGLEHGEIGFHYDPATGAEITGTIQLAAGIPGIRGGTLHAKIAESRAGGYSLSGEATIQPSIPGVEAEVHGRYEDGAFLVEGDVAYHRGMLSGSVHLGVTNQVPGGDGQPAGPPTDHLTAFGSGQVTIRIAPWLQGTIGLQLQPNGQMIVTGEVALPDHLDVFPEQSVEKNIFTLGIDIPIVGVSVLGQRIGIFATIRGGLDASAGFGPGQLRNLALRVTYNPDREADTRVEGSAAFHVPAHAGLRLFVQGGLGAGIPVVSATAGLEVSGALGLEGAADASTQVSWTPARGVVLDARGEIFVEPKFRFAITGFVSVTADTLVHTFHLYEKRWELAAFEYGSNLRFGVAFPIHYEEGQPFHLGLDQVQFTYPTIDATELLTGLVHHIA